MMHPWDSPQPDLAPRRDFERITARLFKTSHHVDAPFRRRKTDAELIASCEFFELLDRARPGRGRRRGT